MLINEHAALEGVSRLVVFRDALYFVVGILSSKDIIIQPAIFLLWVLEN